MKSEIEKLLKEKTDKFMFVELIKGKTYSFSDAMLKDKIPIPISVEAMSKSVKNRDGDFLVEDIVDGMINIIGIDEKFPHKKYYIEFLKKYNDNIVFLILNRGFKKINEGKLIDALIYFKSAVEISPNSVDALFNYARCLEDIGAEIEEKFDIYMDEAFETFIKLKESSPEFPLSYYHLGFHYSNKNDYEMARKMWTQVLKMDIGTDIREEVINNLRDLDGKIIFEKGYNLILQGRPHEGLELLLSIEEDYLDWWNLMFFIGLGYRQTENFEEAHEYFLKTLELNTGHVDTMNEIGICLMAMENFVDAEKYFKEALKIDIENPEILCNLGINYLNLGNIQMAEKYISKSFELNPDDEITNSWISYLKRLQNKFNN